MPPVPPIRHPGELQLNEPEKAVLAAIDDEPIAIDNVIAACGLPVQNVLSTLSVLEMRRLIRRLGGNRVMRNYLIGLFQRPARPDAWRPAAWPLRITSSSSTGSPPRRLLSSAASMKA